MGSKKSNKRKINNNALKVQPGQHSHLYQVLACAHSQGLTALLCTVISDTWPNQQQQRGTEWWEIPMSSVPLHLYPLPGDARAR